jgi:cytochrome c oxidase assembly protein subunit 15
MVAVSNSSRTAVYKPALAWFAALGAAWVFVLVTLGAFTTSIGAGMAFADWPLSNGSLNPEGWLSNIAMFAEHSHRLSGATMGLITIGLALWLWRTEARRWLRRLGWWALAVVIIQGVIGGQRVRLDAWHPGGLSMSVGQILRIPHGILAQVYVCILIVIAAACSRRWIEGPAVAVSAGTRKLGLVCLGLLFVQLVIAATMRHTYAGLAIPVFPHSTADGGWLPAAWDFRVAIHFAHRVMALVLTIMLPWFVVRVRLERSATKAMRAGATVLIVLLMLQIALGAKIIWTSRDPHMTTGHVVVGALLLATTCWLAWFAHRDLVETKAST